MSTSSTEESLLTALVVDDAASRSALPSSSRSHAVDIIRPCRLLRTPPLIPSLMLDHMDDRTAICYLTSCKLLHVGYHEYPVKQAMPQRLLQDYSYADSSSTP